MRKLIFILFLIVASVSLKAQTGISQEGTDSLMFFNTGNKSMVIGEDGRVRIGGTKFLSTTSILELNIQDYGLLIPRVSSAAAITDPKPGMIAYNTTTNKFISYSASGGWAVILSSSSNYPTKIEDADADTKIEVEQGADEDMIRFTVSATEAMIINSSGQIGIGTNNPVVGLHIAANSMNGIVNQVSHATEEPYFILARSTGNVGSEGPLSSDERIGGFSFNAHDGADFNDAALIYAQTAEAHTPGNHGANLVFSTVPKTSTNLQDRMFISSEGDVGINTAPNPGYKFSVSTTEGVGIDAYADGENATNVGINGTAINGDINAGVRGYSTSAIVSDTAYGVVGSVDLSGAGIGSGVVGYISTSSSNGAVGVQGMSEGTGTGAKAGVSGTAEQTDATSSLVYGGLFQATAQNGTNVNGINSTATQAATGTSGSFIGGVFNVETNGTGATTMGVFANAGAGTSNYAGYFDANKAGTDNYGIYANAINGGNNNFAGYFDNGQVIINDELGIGVNPQEKLHIDGVFMLNTVTTPGTVTDRLYNVGGNLYWNGTQLGAGGGGTQWTNTGSVVHLNTLSDNVAIGASSAGAKLDVHPDATYGGILGQFQNDNSGSGSTILNVITNGSGNAVNVSQSGWGRALYVDHTNSANGQTAAYIQTSGNSNKALELNHTGGQAGSIDYALHATSNGAGTANVAGYFNSIGATNNYAIIVPASGGSVGIGTSSPLELLDVQGRIYLSQTTAPGTTNDRLYNVAGNLYWNGTQLDVSGGDASSIQGYPVTTLTPTDGKVLRYNSGTGEYELWDQNADYIQGIPVSTITPSPGEVLSYTGSDWIPFAPDAQLIQGFPVTTITPSDGKVLRFNSGTGEYELWDVNADYIQGIPVTTVTASPGQVLWYNGSAWDVGDQNATLLQGFPITTVTPSDGKVLRYNSGTSEYELWDQNADYIQGFPVSTVTANPGEVLSFTGSEWYSVIPDAQTLQGFGVTTATPADGQVLTYNNASSQWEAQTPGGGGSSPWSKSGSSIYNTTLTDAVGIGTNSPATQLELESDGGTGITLDAITNTTNDPFIQFKTNGMSRFRIGVDNDDVDKFKFYAGVASPVMTIDNQYIGIGTTSPSTSSKLHIVGSGNGSTVNVEDNSVTNGSLLYLSSTATTGTASNSSKMITLLRSGANTNASHTAYGIKSDVTNTGTTSTNIAGYFSASGATNNYAGIFANGNVGIGTSSPTNLFSIESAPSVTDRNSGTFIDIHHTSVDQRAYIRFSQDNPKSNTFYVGSNFDYVQNEIWSNSNFPIVFGTNDIERMKIDISGNVGIGTTSPSATLDVVGSVQISDGTQGAGKVLTSDASGNASWQTIDGWVKLDEVVLGSNSASINITGLPSGYKMLKIVYYFAGSGGAIANVRVRFNGDVASNYQYMTKNVWDNGSSNGDQTFGHITDVEALASPANWTTGSAMINNIATSKKSMVGSSACQNYGAHGGIYMNQCTWENSTNEINSIEFFLSAGSFITNSRVIIFGL